jgi:hypothetical protein
MGWDGMGFCKRTKILTTWVEKALVLKHLNWRVLGIYRLVILDTSIVFEADSRLSIVQFYDQFERSTGSALVSPRQYLGMYRKLMLDSIGDAALIRAF